MIASEWQCRALLGNNNRTSPFSDEMYAKLFSQTENSLAAPNATELLLLFLLLLLLHSQ
jgi:hypothetical protein